MPGAAGQHTLILQQEPGYEKGDGADRDQIDGLDVEQILLVRTDIGHVCEDIRRPDFVLTEVPAHLPG